MGEAQRRTERASTAKPVFISHSAVDKTIANIVKQFLEERGIGCWIAPRDVPAGAKWAEAIVHAIEHARAIVLILSEHSNRSEQVMNEIARSVSQGKPIVPLKISSVTPSRELDYFISRRHWLDASNDRVESVLPQLAADLRPILAQGTPGLPRGPAPTPQSAPGAWRRLRSRKSRLVVGMVFMTLLVVLGLFVFIRSRAATTSKMSPLTTAYQTLERGNLTPAEQDRRVTQLVAELVQAHRQGRKPDSPNDGWTSSPLTLAFLYEAFAPKTAAEEFLLQSMEQALRASERIVLIERQVLEKLLAELQLNTTELVDPQLTLRLGRILGARLLAKGSIMGGPLQGRLSVHLIETETTQIRAAGTTVFEASGALETVVPPLARDLVQQVRQEFPLQGRIARVTPTIVLDIGSEQGMTPGLIMQVISEWPIKRNGKLEYLHDTVGEIEVTAVQTRLSQARWLEGSVDFQAGWKVREQVREGQAR